MYSKDLPYAQPQPQCEVLDLHEQILATATTWAGRPCGMGQLIKSLKTQGCSQLASRLHRMVRARNALAHPDVCLADDVDSALMKFQPGSAAASRQLSGHSSPDEDEEHASKDHVDTPDLRQLSGHSSPGDDEEHASKDLVDTLDIEHVDELIQPIGPTLFDLFSDDGTHVDATIATLADQAEKFAAQELRMAEMEGAIRQLRLMLPSLVTVNSLDDKLDFALAKAAAAAGTIEGAQTEAPFGGDHTWDVNDGKTEADTSPKQLAAKADADDGGGKQTQDDDGASNEDKAAEVKHELVMSVDETFGRGLAEADGDLGYEIKGMAGKLIDLGPHTEVGDPGHFRGTTAVGDQGPGSARRPATGSRANGDPSFEVFGDVTHHLQQGRNPPH
jgi:hypothetical protein